MAARLIQAPLPWLPDGAVEVASGVGLVTGQDGSGAVWVHGMLTFCWEPAMRPGGGWRRCSWSRPVRRR